MHTLGVRAVRLVVLALAIVLASVAAGCSEWTGCALGGSCPKTVTYAGPSTDPPPPKIRPRDVGRVHYARCVHLSVGSDWR